MREKVTLVLCPLITLVVVITFWNLYLEIFEVPNYILPDPYSVVSTFIAVYWEGHIWPHVFFTFKSTALGYFFGCGLGLTLGSLLAESRIFEKFMYIYFSKNPAFLKDNVWAQHKHLILLHNQLQ